MDERNERITPRGKGWIGKEKKKERKSRTKGRKEKVERRRGGKKWKKLQTSNVHLNDHGK